jgi:hypothetical protein
VAVELLGKSQDFRRTEIDAETAAFATVPINKDLTAELPCFRCCGSLRHLDLDGRAAFSEPGGAFCPTWTPLLYPEHSRGHFDRLLRVVSKLPTVRLESIGYGCRSEVLKWLQAEDIFSSQ